MNFINWNNPPEDPVGLSMRDLQKMYRIVFRMLQECKRMKGATEGVLSKAVRGEREAKKSARILKKEVTMISKKAAAAQSLRETSGWSAAAIGAVTLLWAGFAEYGYPGPAWLFEHEFFYGAVCWVATSVFAWAAKGFYSAH